ncbi:ribosome small subunit-dependent GTPase A [Novosphingobium resinovorum]|nr:ribosome small subunit-dependent GTPase A [Novosphingobium resinovorum]
MKKAHVVTMEASGPTLEDLGWNSFFADQLSAEEQAGEVCPVRVMAVHRGMVDIAGSGLSGMINSALPLSEGPEDRAAVGDWLMVDRERLEPVRILDRINLFKRKAPADQRRLQLIAANVDTLFIVTSCNQDFNVARLERYLVMAREVGVRPVVVLTKVDLAEAPERFLEAARALQPDLEVEMVNGRDPASVGRLARYCGKGRTVALLGSSGVGKSTMINGLRGSDDIETQPIREIDGKGRHTTTGRQLYPLDGPAKGGWLVDTPGMREFHLPDAATGIAEVFDDITALTQACRFGNCTHTTEKSCAVLAALRDGTLEPRRLERWRKLRDEDADSTQGGGRRPASAGGRRRKRHDG